METLRVDYGLGVADIDRIVAALKEHWMTAIRETQSIPPDTARRILQDTL